jgi:hypothetical protein
MTDDRSLQQKVDDAARATWEIWLERLTAEAFAAAEQQTAWLDPGERSCGFLRDSHGQ